MEMGTADTGVTMLGWSPGVECPCNAGEARRPCDTCSEEGTTIGHVNCATRPRVWQRHIIKLLHVSDLTWSWEPAYHVASLIHCYAARAVESATFTQSPMCPHAS